MSGIPQGSISGPLVFSIFICDLFTILEETCFSSYADDHTLFVSEATPEKVVNSLESCSTDLFEWFSNNKMKTNTVSHLLMNVNRSATIETGEHTISNSYCEKLLGVKIDIQLNFNNHLETIIQKDSQEVHVHVSVFQKENY